MSEVFQHNGLSAILIDQLDGFIRNKDFAELYKSYDWERDNHSTGFKDILRLERRLRQRARTGGIVCDDIREVAQWGRKRGRTVECSTTPTLPSRELYLPDGGPILSLADCPTSPIDTLDKNTKYVGPTYLSKVLRFAMPEQYGAIDTWCVRVFGQGDAENGRRNWLSLKVRNDGYGWYIPKTKRLWPSEYGKWVNILRYFSHCLPANCPHPPAFVEEGLREGGKWTCADVEMALFACAKNPKSAKAP